LGGNSKKTRKRKEKGKGEGEIEKTRAGEPEEEVQAGGRLTGIQQKRVIGDKRRLL